MVKHSIDRLSRKMHEILILVPVDIKESTPNMTITTMSYLKLAPNLASLVLAHNTLKLILT
jgi:hypothetical protein